ncbi:hypothetical protein AQI84_29880 [Streptomyces griseorubiginosus]|uniref:Uncharacterized protein n=1 Tax=Streptomyces griseorubiginosus TaxID=67304 RepID=A0AAI8L6U4_9ACTN|nr:hypothetical protein DWG14_06695 [Streptomyces griseorubiginosus]KUM71043.1 hypothetical protein AQI84_29880 [Streptomyces griseorubiginosus]
MPPSESTGTIPPWIYEYAASRSFQDAVRKVVDAKWLADNVPVTGAKAEVTGVKAEANALAASAFGVQTEYGLVKHEATLFDINKILEGRVQEARDKEQDRRLHVLSVEAVSIKDLVQKVKTDLIRDAGDIRRAQSAGDRQVERLVADLRGKVGTIQKKLLADDQVLHERISKLTTRVGKVSEVAHNADARSKASRVKTDEVLGKVKALDREVERGRKLVGKLDKEVGTGMQRVGALERSATSASRSIQGLHDHLNGLEQALRR